MSRIGKRPVEIPTGVDIKIDGNVVTVQAKGVTLQEQMPNGVTLSREDGSFVVERVDESREARAAHGLARTLIANMVQGVTSGFSRKLKIDGVGYRAELRGDRYILFTLGYSHPILYRVPEGLTAAVDAKENSVTLTGANKQLLGAAAAEIRGLRPPEPYKGKGVRYIDETIRRKEGKAGGKK